ncbi:MAG: sulfotransferase family protein [Candidatus Binataceae bacterium]
MAILSGHLAPDFVGIGPSRTGTTWLHEVLAHRTCVPRDFKETDYFSRRIQRGYAWYARQYRHFDGRSPLGEFSPSYFTFPETPQRIDAANPRCKIICTLRDPVERAYSHYKLLRRSAWTRFEFEECVARHPHIRDENRYAFHLRRWLDRFGDDRALVMLFDDLCADEQAFADGACDFIGVERIDLRSIALPREAHNSIKRAPKNPKLAQNARHLRMWLREHNAHRLVGTLQRWDVWRWCFGRGGTYAPLSPEVDARLRAQFRPEVEELEKIIGRDLSNWKYGRSSARETGVSPSPFNAARLRA